MNLKKCGFLLVFVMMFCFAIPNFASAAVVDLLEGKIGIMEKTGKAYKNMTDGNSQTFDELLSSNYVVFDLEDVYVIDKYTINETKGYSDPGTGTNVIYYDSDRRVLRNFPNKYEVTEKVDGVRYVGLRYDYLNRKKIYEFKVYGTTDKVTDVENLKAKVDLNQVTLSWDNPDTPKFTGVNIYQGKYSLGKLDKTKNSYVVKGLKEAEGYDFTVKAIDENGFETSGKTVKVMTNMPVLDPPKSVFLTPQNGSLVINWERVNSPFLKGYNVYVNGKKITDELLNSNKLILNNLENGKEYSVQVSAVNLQDKEGNKSGAVIESPSKDATTIEYDVKVPMTGVELLKTAGTIVLWLSPFILLGIAVIWFKPLRKLIVKAVMDHKKKGEKK
ncbi:fibronectin type III domain-containing protein [Bacillus thuringiensis]|uniref:fibronectin type III domain-containing protein n=1 Tax=Bacillus thuringiensis TaxID=1428 RepID=UPI001427E824|nr:fibronectin type III domain-containing protein [Bacillus thuringiensis]NIL33885.1 fibronectin type III domain-containing protein [Bacillus thuringiensis]